MPESRKGKEGAAPARGRDSALRAPGASRGFRGQAGVGPGCALPAWVGSAATGLGRVSPETRGQRRALPGGAAQPRAGVCMRGSGPGVGPVGAWLWAPWGVAGRRLSATPRTGSTRQLTGKQAQVTLELGSDHTRQSHQGQHRGRIRSSPRAAGLVAPVTPARTATRWCLPARVRKRNLNSLLGLGWGLEAGVPGSPLAKDSVAQLVLGGSTPLSFGHSPNGPSRTHRSHRASPAPGAGPTVP